MPRLLKQLSVVSYPPSPRLRRINQLSVIYCLLSFIFYQLSFFPSPVIASEASLSATSSAETTAQAQESGDWLDRLLGRIKEEKIDETLAKYNQSNLPFNVKIDPAKEPKEGQDESLAIQQAAEEKADANPAYRTAGEYTLATSTQTSHEQVSTNLLESILNLLRKIGSIFGRDTVVDLGDQKAKEFLGTQSPYELVEDGQNTASFLASDQNRGQAMKESLGNLQCGQLPWGVGNCPETNILYGEEETTEGESPEVTPKEEPQPTIPEKVPTPSVYLFPASKTGDLACANKIPNSTLLTQLFYLGGKWKSIPGAIIAAFGCVEGGHIWTYSDSQVQDYSRENGQIPNCTINACAAQGPMQMTVGRDYNGNPLCPNCPGAIRLGQCPNQWGKFGDAAKEALGRSSTNACNLTDSIYAATKKLDFDRSIKNQWAAASVSFAQFCARATNSWDDPNLISCATGAFYGQCQMCQQKEDGSYTTSDCNRFYKAFGIAINYCEFTNMFYKQWKDVYDFTPKPTVTPDAVSKVFYCQQDNLHQIPVGKGCTISDVGCAQTTAAMILSTYVDKKYTPSYVVDNLYQDSECDGTFIGESKDVFENKVIDKKETKLPNFNFETTDYFFTHDRDDRQPLSVVFNDLKRYSDAGWEIFAVADINNIGHMFWITEVSENGDIWVMDPWYGCGKAYPMRQNYLNPLFKRAFGVRKK